MFGLMVDGFKWGRYHKRENAEEAARRELRFASVMAAWVEDIGPLDHTWETITILDKED